LTNLDEPGIIEHMFDCLEIAAAGLRQYDAASIQADSLDDALIAAFRLRAVAESIWLATVTRVDELGVAKKREFRTAADLVAATVGEQRGRVQGDIELGKRLAAQPTFGYALRDGVITRAKAVELARADNADEIQQRQLLAIAESSSIRKTREAVEKFRADSDQPTTPITNSVTVTHGNGSGTVRATFEPVRLSLFETAIDIALRKLGLPKELAFDGRRAEALVAICKFFVEHVDNATTVRGSRPHVSVVIDIETLERRANTPARLDNGDLISAETARKLCCDAGFSRIITDMKGRPLNIGTNARNWPAHIARAIIARDKHCVHEKCEAPAWACEIHHIIHVTDHGETSTDNGELRCWFHHDVQHVNDEKHKREQRLKLDRESRHGGFAVAA
jgi:hypothetical protein